MTTTVKNSRAKKNISKPALKTRISAKAKSKQAPFHEPNAESLAAIEEAEAGNLTPTTLAELRSIWDNA